MEKVSPLIIFLQEHWLPNHELSTISSQFSEHNFHSTSSDMFIPPEELLLAPSTSWHGSSIGWSMKIDMFVTKIPVVSERFCGISYTNNDCHIVFYTVYLPTSGKDEDFLEVLAQLTTNITQNRTESKAIVIGADTNQSKKSTKRRIDAMKKFICDFGLKSALVSNEPTLNHNNLTSSSQIDNIFYHIPELNAINVKFLEHLCKFEDSSNLSSHDVIVGNMSLPLVQDKIRKEDFTESYKPFLVKKPIWDETGMNHYQTLSFNNLSSLLEKYNGPEFIPALSEMFSKTLVISAENSFETVSSDVNKKKKKQEFSKEHLKAYRDHEQICRKWRRSGRPSSNLHPDKAAKLESQRRLQKIARDEAAIKAIKIHDELMNCHANDINKVYSKLKRMRGDNIRNQDITSIETLCGKYDGDNVLEGFCANTEKLCSVKRCSDMMPQDDMPQDTMPQDTMPQDNIPQDNMPHGHHAP